MIHNFSICQNQQPSFSIHQNTGFTNFSFSNTGTTLLKQFSDSTREASFFLRGPPAAAVPFGLLGVEDVLQVAREELREDLVWVEGVGSAVLLVQDLRQSLATRPVGDSRPYVD